MHTFALVCAADFAAEDFAVRVSRGEFDRVIAVDAGLRHVCSAGAAPDVLLGDFDSLGSFDADSAPAIVEHPPIKDKSDLELAIAYATAQGAEELVVYGCLGARLDHTIAALQNLAAAAEAGLRVFAIAPAVPEAHDANARRPRAMVLTVLVGPAELDLEVPVTLEPEDVAALGAPTFGTVSVFAAGESAQGVREAGLFYPLDDANVTNRTSLGLSNELVERRGSICVRSGTLYAWYPADLEAHIQRH